MRHAIAILSLFALVSSCDHEEPPLTKEQLLSTGEWIVTEHLISLRNENNYFADGKLTCNNDDYFKFDINGRFLQYNGATRCESTDPSIDDKGTWSFNSDKTKILVSFSKFTFPFYVITELSIQQLDNSTLKVTAVSDQNADTLPDYHKYTLTKR